MVFGIPDDRLATLLFATAAALSHAARRQQAEAWAAVPAPPCPCEDASLCTPIGGPAVSRREVYGFAGGGSDWSRIDYSRVTTVAWPSGPQDMCAAHAGGARAVLAAPALDDVLTPNATARAAWVAAAVKAVVGGYYDGIVFDWEEPCAAGAPSQHFYAVLIGETKAALKALSLSYQVSTCVAWSPDDIDGRAYDVRALGAASDLLYIMDYDTRSQIFDACIAAANAPLPGAIRGLKRYLDLGIDPATLVLGVPWYGYRYPCLPGTAHDAMYCPIAAVPFRGVNCSDAAGSEHAYSEITGLIARSTTGRRWDANQGAPFFNTVEKGVTVQYWYDDVSSLVPKYQKAAALGVRGVGPFTFNDVDASPDHDAMYGAFDAFLHAPRP